MQCSLFLQVRFLGDGLQVARSKRRRQRNRIFHRLRNDGKKGFPINNVFPQGIHAIALGTYLHWFLALIGVFDGQIIGQFRLFHRPMTKPAFSKAGFHLVQLTMLIGQERNHGCLIAILFFLRNDRIHSAEHILPIAAFLSKLLGRYGNPTGCDIQRRPIEIKQFFIHMAEPLLQNLPCFLCIIGQHIEMTAAGINQIGTRKFQPVQNFIDDIFQDHL